MAEAGQLPFPPARVNEFGERMRALSCPPVHHSEAYAAAYLPAYRVVARASLPQALTRG
jgi:hypothetical protein